MDGFERRKGQNKESIRRAALELFKTYGFKKVSINEIAHKAGVSPVTIYNHFGSKDELVRETIKAQFLDMMQRYRAIIDKEGSFPEKLETIIFDKTEIAGQFQGELAQTVFQNDPEMKQFVETLWRGDVGQLTIDLIEEGRRQGYVSPELSQEAILLYLELLRRGIAASTDLLATMEPDVKLYRELNNLFVYGLVGKRK